MPPGLGARTTCPSWRFATQSRPRRHVRPGFVGGGTGFARDIREQARRRSLIAVPFAGRVSRQHIIAYRPRRLLSGSPSASESARGLLEGDFAANDCRRMCPDHRRRRSTRTLTIIRRAGRVTLDDSWQAIATRFCAICFRFYVGTLMLERNVRTPTPSNIQACWVPPASSSNARRYYPFSTSQLQVQFRPDLDSSSTCAATRRPVPA